MAFVFVLPKTAEAQNAGGALVSATYGIVRDTVSSGVTKYLVTPSFTSNFKDCSVSFTLTNISGTTSVTATLQYSLDGTTWFSLSDTVYATQATGVTAGWKWTGYPQIKTRVALLGVGTQSTKVEGDYRFKN